MDKKNVLPERVRRACELHQVHETAESLRAGATDVGDISSIKSMAQQNGKEIKELCAGDAHDLMTNGEFFAFVLMSALPAYGIIGLIAATVGIMLGNFNAMLGYASFFAISLAGGAFATIAVWNAAEKYLPKIWAKIVGARKLRVVEDDLLIIKQHC